MARLCILISMLVAFCAVSACWAGVVYVDKDATGGGTGESWADACNSIGAGIADANYGDQVWVAAGVYEELVTMKNGVGLYGGFAGGEAMLEERDYAANVCVIDANYTGAVVTITVGSDPNTRVDGFLITRGDAIHGGGVKISGSAAVIANNVITGNKTNGLGAGIYCFGFEPVTGEEATIIGNAIVDNLAYEDEGNGGGIGCHGSSPTIVGNLIARNIASRNGGGISCWASEADYLILSSSPVIANNYILANSASVLQGASGAHAGGGGIHCTATDLSGSPISGAVSRARIINNVIAANGGWLGGGLCLLDSIVEACTVINNTIVANNGSGIYWQNTSPMIANNLVAYNTWGLEQMANMFTNPTILHNCVYGNRVKGKSADFRHVTDPTGTNGNISVEPKLAGYYVGDCHIQPDSPCVDAGDMNSVGEGWTDIDEQGRALGDGVDIGADESDGTVWETAQNVIHVTSDGNDGSDGLTWETAKRTVGAGIAAAASTYGEIWVAAGTYEETIKLPAFVYLYGGFDGTEDSWGEREPAAHQSIIDANGRGCVVTATNAGYLVSTVDGFTIQGGSPLIEGYELIQRGGGIWTTCSSPVIANNRIESNQADDPLWPGFLLDGGGMYMYLSYPYIVNNVFTNNKVNNTTVGQGGAIYSFWSMPSIVNNDISYNSARFGPALFAERSEPFVARNLIYQNGGPPYYGAAKGAITLTLCPDFHITHNTVAANVASNGGGLNIQSCFDGAIENNLIINNYAYEMLSGFYGAGGGIFLEVPASPNDTLYVTNNTISGNVASSLIEDQGGGIAIAAISDELVVANNIIAGNSSGIWMQLGPTGTPTLKHNCVYNSGSNYVRIAAGPNDISVDPEFVDAEAINFRLGRDSACIDAGDSGATPAAITGDMDGLPRFVDDICTADTGAGAAPVVDMGAYEFVRADVNRDGSVDFEDYAGIAVHWLETGCEWCGGAEQTCDGAVGADDLGAFSQDWLVRSAFWSE